MDASGSHQLEIMHDVFKKRVDHSGAEIHGVAVPAQRGTLKTTEGLLKEKTKAEEEGRPADPDAVAAAAAAREASGADPSCGSCYGAQQAPDECCNTCESVRDAYR